MWLAFNSHSFLFYLFGKVDHHYDACHHSDDQFFGGDFPSIPNPGGYTGEFPTAGEYTIVHNYFPGEYTIYFPSGAFDLKDYHGTNYVNNC